MIELGQLDKRHEEFAKRNTRVVVVSIEPAAVALKTQADFQHLTVLADAGRGLSQVMEVLHPHAAPDGGDLLMPTTILIDRSGIVRWIHRTNLIVARPSPNEVLKAIDSTIVTAR